MKNGLVLLLLSTIFSSLKAQDHLRPEDGFFGSRDFQVEYYSKVRKLLYAGLDDRPNARVLILPSFAPEGVFDLSFNEKMRNYVISVHTADKSIWYNEMEKNKKKVTIIKHAQTVDKNTAQLMINLFNKALNTVKYPEKDSHGLDGTTYHFMSFDRNLRAGYTWSPRENTEMGKLVEIVQELIGLTMKNKNKSFVLPKTLKNKIDQLTKTL